MIPFCAIGPGPDYPLVAEVASGADYDFGNLTGTYSPSGSYTAASNVRLGADRGDGVNGTLAVPTASQVLSGVSVDATVGNVVVPSVGDVQESVTFGPSSGSTGTFVVPDEAEVESGVGYGAAGTEFEGTLTGGGSGDWTSTEKAQIRYRLGIDGASDVPSATGHAELDSAAQQQLDDIQTSVDALSGSTGEAY